MRHSQPHARPGALIGLLGGSFDPAHEGHVRITRAALRRFGLDAVWWLVSPGNPLKTRGPAPLEDRIARARAVMRHPRVTITGIEAELGTRYTAQTIAALQDTYPLAHFTWLMGGDNLSQFHLWQDWRDIAARVPLGILARPRDRARALHSPTARMLRHARLPESAAPLLPRSTPPAWCFLNIPMSDQSSTRIRAATGWGDTT
ncbi:MAG: nicotinic acid mononucleotide adenylyltransferase [Rhodobacterales bacterium]|nr:MAG: nicotinic acid mononucleotide adenylyltransferase [Rhodobacterales bacterium]